MCVTHSTDHAQSSPHPCDKKGTTTHEERRFDAYYFVGDYGKSLESYTQLTGRPMMPPVYALDEHASNKPTLFVGNLSWTITSEALFARLGGIGSVVACEVKRNGRGQSKGFALATFQSEEAAQRAIAEFHGAVLEGRRLGHV